MMRRKLQFMLQGNSRGRSRSLSFVSIHHRLDSASPSLTPPTHLVLPTTPSSRSRLHPPNSSSSFTLTVASRRELHAVRDDSRAFGGYGTTEHSPQTYWWHVRAINYTKYRDTAASTPSPFSLQHKLHRVFLCACASCPHACPQK